MGNKYLLDCTLRDGGYVNDWDFGHDNLVSVFERVVDAGIDVIEIGFLDERRPFDMNRSIMPDSASAAKIYGNLDRKNTLVVGMIDFGTCSLEHIQPCEESFLDGIRVIFKKHLREPALAFCKELKALGYKVFSQLVSVTSYSDEEMMDLIRLANEVEPYAVSMVDTYGLMHQENLMHYFELLNTHLKPEIMLAYHGHNNFQMGYANCIAMIEKNIERDILIDGSIYGMGKSAGNAPLELIAMHLNDFYGKNYNISQILEAIDSNIMQFYKPATWGYNMFYYIAGLNKCHPNYVGYLMNKRTLSVKSINEILGKLQGEKKLLYDKDYVETLYVDYQNKEINDAGAVAALTALLSGKTVLLMGPGKTIQTQKEAIEAFINEQEPVVISVNYIPEGFEPDHIFLGNAKRYIQLATALAAKHHSIIATSNVTGTAADAFDYTLNFSALMDKDAEFIDNSLIMALKAMVRFNVGKIVLAGFDGFHKDADNYYNMGMEYVFVKSKVDYLNTYIKAFIQQIGLSVQVSFITDSVYREAAK